MRPTLPRLRSLRELYRTLEPPGKNPLRDAHQALDAAVQAAYAMKPTDDALAFLLALNLDLADREATMKPVVGPGLPPCVTDGAAFVTDDCVRVGWPPQPSAEPSATTDAILTNRRAD